MFASNLSERMVKRLFFSDKKWSNKLSRLIDEYCRSHSFSGYYEAKEEQEKQIRDELLQSRLAIEANIPGKKVRHFSFPWNPDREGDQQLVGGVRL